MALILNYSSNVKKLNYQNDLKYLGIYRVKSCNTQNISKKLLDTMLS